MEGKPYKLEPEVPRIVSEPAVSYGYSGQTSVIDSYWELLRDLSMDLKLKLISKLSNSILEGKTKDDATTRLADRFYGAWKDDKSAEELIEIIHERGPRTRHIEPLD